MSTKNEFQKNNNEDKPNKGTNIIKRQCGHSYCKLLNLLHCPTNIKCQRNTSTLHKVNKRHNYASILNNNYTTTQYSRTLIGGSGQRAGGSPSDSLVVLDRRVRFQSVTQHVQAAAKRNTLRGNFERKFTLKLNRIHWVKTNTSRQKQIRHEGQAKYNTTHVYAVSSGPQYSVWSGSMMPSTGRSARSRIPGGEKIV